ncbi:MAG: flagellar hook-length control protein FliK [Candidatus Abyssobacteria bacterium SURF_5]|uniref:Flagellar hook-length control protein FliK n=1 Tax=Abyssobacteria bacterium (strain SURF_5) TaxID=2093360 RepID=A0A3A4NT69_ABYX5|nr:MAG: flagellar hook-length control protein FliK [Candidatus Abyssubacteria bacterium SURF_5]
MSLPPLNLQLTASFPASPLENLRHGDLLAGKVVRIEPDGSRLISFSGLTAIARAADLLSPGRQVFACVQKNLSQINIVLLPALKPNEMVTGKVLSSDSAGLLIALDGIELHAQSRPQLLSPEPGTLVQGQVHMHGGKPVFFVSTEQSGAQPSAAEKLEKPAPAFAEISRLYSEAMIVQKDVSALMSMLQNLHNVIPAELPWLDSLLKILSNMLLKPEEKAFAEKLAFAAENSGLSLEARLLRESGGHQDEQPVRNDLKLALLQALQELSRIRADGSRQNNFQPQLIENLTRLFETVRAQQLLNIHLFPSGQFYIQLPMSESSGLQQVQILITQQQKKNTKIDARNITVTIAVSASSLGNIKASISIFDGQMTCQFKTSHEWVGRLIEENVESLRQALKNVDCHVAHIGVLVTADQQSLSLVDDLLLSRTGGINICV